jgi:hypothetical protein
MSKPFSIYIDARSTEARSSTSGVTKETVEARERAAAAN